MVTLTHEVLGTIEFDDEGVADTHIELAGRVVEVDINLDDKVPAELPAAALRFVADVARFDAVARAALASDLEASSSSEVGLYISHHLSEVSAKHLEACMGRPVAELEPTTFLSGMHLYRVGLYPERPDFVAVFDYTFSRELTDYVLSVSFDEDGRAVSVAMES